MYNTERFLDEICSDIPDRRTRENVKAEIRDHIEARMEEFILYGDTQEEAERKAIADMGDPKRLTRELGGVNSFFPLKRFKNALTLFYFGFLLSSLYFDIWELWYLKNITSAIGSCLLLIALFFLRAGNGELRTAFFIGIAHTVVAIVVNVCDVLPPFEQQEILFWVTLIAGQILVAVRMFCFGYGIARFAQEEAARGAKQIGYLYLAESFFVWLAFFVEDIIPLSFVLVLLFVVLILRRIRHANNDIWYNDRAVKTVKLGRMCTAALCVLIGCSVLLPICTAYCQTVTPPEPKAYSAFDLSGEEAERAEEIRAQLNAKIDVIFDADRRLSAVLCDVRQSELLRLEAKSYTFAFNAEYGILSMDIIAAHGDKRATVLSLYAYSYEATETSALQSAYVAEGCLVLNGDTTPVRFVQLYSENGKTVQVDSSYEYIGTDRVGNEFKVIKNKAQQRGYALFDIEGYSAAYFRYRMEQISFYRSPYNYAYLESYPEVVVRGWMMIDKKSTLFVALS